MKQLNFLLATLISSATCFSQMHFGIDPGVALSRGSYKSSADYNRRIFLGFDGGVFAEIGVTPKFMIQPELNYSIRGVELNDGEKETTIKRAILICPYWQNLPCVLSSIFMLGHKLEC